MNLKGKVWKFGDDVNTDDIIAAKYLITADAQELGKHCMETISADFVSKMSKGDIIVGGKNFGCGSSREHAPLSIKGCGISCVIAKSFAGIFLRNSINIALPLIECEQTDEIKGGDELLLDLVEGKIKNVTQNREYRVSKFPAFLQEIILSGGLIQWIKKKENIK
ncbi:MAG: 3-isopropylmalate dehydratase small subunit [Candidatus Omnitrophota bacterium]